MYNKITLIGRLGRDAEAMESKAGNKYWKFSIATNEWISSKGEEETTWHNITCFNDYVGKMLDDKGKAGTLLYIEGKQQYNTYMNKEGQEVTAGQVVMDRFGSVCKIMERSQPKSSGNVKPSVNEDEFDDSVPF
jgi:single-strand DNA-binding protein